jgi:hypothetical protein
MKFVSRTTPQSGAFITQSELSNLFPKLALGFHTRDSKKKSPIVSELIPVMDQSFREKD